MNLIGDREQADDHRAHLAQNRSQNQAFEGGVFTISPDYSDRDPRLFGALVRSQPVVRPIGANLSGSRSVPALHLFKGEQTETVRLTL
jgi:hypothetical protein